MTYFHIIEYHKAHTDPERNRYQYGYYQSPYYGEPVKPHVRLQFIRMFY